MAVRVVNLTKTFASDAKVVAVNNVSFEAPDAQITSLLGPSGSGKSTILRLIAGLELADHGSVYIDGEDVVSIPTAKRNIGFVFQNYALFGHMTVAQNVAFGLKVRGVSKQESAPRVNELLELVQLGGYQNRYPNELSGGQRQRIALARALAPDPRVLLLDEPFGALDTRVRAELRQWLGDVHSQTGVTTILVTHDQHEALELSEHIVLLKDGEVEQAGPPDVLYLEPANAFVASFLGDAQVLEGTVVNGRATFAGIFELARSEPERATVQLFLRPQDIELADSGPSVRVDRITRVGPHTRLTVSTGDGTRIRIQLPRHELVRTAIAEGSTVRLRLRSTEAAMPGA